MSVNDCDSNNTSDLTKHKVYCCLVLSLKRWVIWGVICNPEHVHYVDPLARGVALNVGPSEVRTAE